MTSRRLHFGVELPANLIRNVERWPDNQLAPGWLDSLPPLVQDVSERFGITFEPEIPDTGLTLVLLGTSTQFGPVVFKSQPIANELRSEATGLKLAAGPHVSRVYEADMDRNFMLVERIQPGIQLRQVDLPDEEATLLAARLALEFRTTVADATGLQPLERWMRELLEWKSHPDVIADELTIPAMRMARELLDDRVAPSLMHGDLQHHNILQRSNGDWAIIDPKGVHGDPGFEVCAWMYNPPEIQDHPGYRELTRTRLEIFAEVWKMDLARLTRWAFVGSVLSAAWSAHGATWLDWFAGQIKVARTLQSLIR